MSRGAVKKPGGGRDRTKLIKPASFVSHKTGRLTHRQPIYIYEGEDPRVAKTRRDAEKRAARKAQEKENATRDQADSGSRSRD